jgi:hypothetical protein
VTRRDRCYFVGHRARTLTPAQAAKALEVVGRRLEALGDRDMPKFVDLLSLIRAATIVAKSQRPAPPMSVFTSSDEGEKVNTP